MVSTPPPSTFFCTWGRQIPPGFGGREGGVFTLMRPKISVKKSYHQARYLRHHHTPAEARLWAHIRANQLDDVHFRRQYAIGKYIVDFCAPYHKLIVELDGSHHLEQAKQDSERTEFLKTRGYREIRFRNNDVMNNLDNVIKAIEHVLNKEDKMD